MEIKNKFSLGDNVYICYIKTVFTNNKFSKLYKVTDIKYNINEIISVTTYDQVKVSYRLTNYHLATPEERLFKSYEEAKEYCNNKNKN